MKNDNNKMLTKRIAGFDAIKAFAIFLVIWAHCIQHLGPVDRFDDITYVLIYSFHMPLFMFVAGYFSMSSLKMKFSPLFLKKFKELLIPCLSWGVIVIVVSQIIGREGDLKKGLIYAAVVKEYWFLRSLFFCYLLGYVITRCNNTFKIILLICVSVISLYKLNVMFPAFICGYYIRQHSMLENPKFASLKVVLPLAGIFLFLNFFCDAHFLNTNNNVPEFFKTGSLCVWGNYFYITFYRIVVGLSGSLVIVILFYKYVKCPPSFICKIGSVTMGIYLVQRVLLERLLPQMFKYEGDVIVFDVIISPLFSIAIMIACYYIILLIQRSKITRQILLGR